MQSAQNLKPLFKMLRSRELGEDVVRHLAEIIHYAQVRQYQKANDAYLRLSIGNAAWPIGVTSVGIHERSSREKIQQDNIAHVLNDEVSRKYIQAVKRCVGVCDGVWRQLTTSQAIDVLADCPSAGQPVADDGLGCSTSSVIAWLCVLEGRSHGLLP